MLDRLISIARPRPRSAKPAVPAPAPAREPVLGDVENDVLTGRNGTLFIHQGAQRLYDQALGRRSVPETAVDTFAENLGRRESLCAEVGAAYAHLFSPEKQVVMAADHPAPDMHSPAGRFRARVGNRCLWPRDVLAHADYHRTDSHWNVTGQLKVADLLLKTWELDRHRATVAGWRQEMTERRFTGDLGARLARKPSEQARVLPPNEAIRRYTNGLERGGTDGVIEVLTNTAPLVHGTLLVFGTSATQIMRPVLGQIFELVVHCRGRYLHGDVLQMVRPDYCLTENQERDAWATDSDENALPFFMVPQAKGRQPEYDDRALDVVAAAFAAGSARRAALIETLRAGGIPGRFPKRRPA